ncbi:MAG: Unknown protein [uncultured Sulfurovum sp.]|uniref:AMIN domain-containing protein n=1 Tax=uncultured Sulfurovum sp. TaxID=269237 RepID=A0A6S6TSS2_9BACT|nr:MAG: Unknown protein [uncultured Sulfurovum sp.]
MNRGMLFLIFSLFFLGCETGIRYDKNMTKIENIDSQSIKRELSQRHDADIEALAEDKGEDRVEHTFDDDLHPIIIAEDKALFEMPTKALSTFSGGVVQDGLNIKSIRVGRHDGFIRLVFDVYDELKPASKVGHYQAKYNPNENDISVVLSGYRKFSATLPSFSTASDIEKIYFEKYYDDSAFKFHIKLRHQVKVRVFALKNPARLVFDIKAI